ncbi:protein of unknown function [Pararobbsia alpina]
MQSDVKSRAARTIGDPGGDHRRSGPPSTIRLQSAVARRMKPASKRRSMQTVGRRQRSGATAKTPRMARDSSDTDRTRIALARPGKMKQI